MPQYLLNRSWSHPHSDDRVQSIRQRPVSLVSGCGRLWDGGEEGAGPWRQVGLQDPGQRAALEGHMKALAFRQLTVPSDVLQHVVEDVDVYERTLWLLVSSPFLCWFGPGGSAGHLSQRKVRDCPSVRDPLQEVKDVAAAFMDSSKSKEGGLSCFLLVTHL